MKKGSSIQEHDSDAAVGVALTKSSEMQMSAVWSQSWSSDKSRNAGKRDLWGTAAASNPENTVVWGFVEPLALPDFFVGLRL
jgi:hypothetical protein